MFLVEYRTVSARPDFQYPTHFAHVGTLHASTCQEAEDYILENSRNIEIVGVRNIGSL